MVTHRALVVFFSVVVAAAAAENPKVGDWPLFRGNSLQTGVAAIELPDNLDILWKFPTGKDGVESTAAIANGIAYVGSLNQYVYALDLPTGQKKWDYKGGPFKAPISCYHGSVFAGDEDGKLHCLDAASGKKRWIFEAGGEITSGSNFTGEKMLFGTGAETLHCLSLQGKELWNFKVPGGPVMGTPALVDGRTFAAGCDSALHVIETDKGKELASLELGSQTGASIAVAGDRIYLGTMGNQVLAIDWKKPEIAWKFESPKGQPFFSSAAVTDKLVIVGSRDKFVYALDRATSKEVWKVPTRGRVDSSPVVAGKRVYVGSLDGNLYVLDLATGKEVQKLNLGGPISASPAISGGRLVIGTQDGMVYCIGAKN